MLACLAISLLSLGPPADDVKRYVDRSRYKAAGDVVLPGGAQRCTAIAAPNAGGFSYLCLAAGSDKSLHVLDWNTGAIVRSVAVAQTRAVHTLVVPPPALLGADAFLSAAAGGAGAALWDLRCLRPARLFSAHVSVALPVAVDFSPCGRFVAAGSEDRVAYLYDVRCVPGVVWPS